MAKIKRSISTVLFCITKATRGYHLNEQICGEKSYCL